jgi:DNA replication protein DnaC
VDVRLANCTPALKATLQEIRKDQRWPVYFHGLPGRGKTCAAAILYRLHGVVGYGRDGFSDWPCVWRSCSAAVSELLGARMSGGTRWQRAWSGAPLAVLDDVGMRDLTPAQFDSLLWLCNAREGRPLIVTSNLSPKDLAGALGDSRIPSRLAAGWVVEVTGEDMRGHERRAVRA